MNSALLVGTLIGMLGAAQVGPIWLLCARTAARFGFRPGAALGSGVALVDFLYGVVGALGAAALLQAVALRLALGLVGAGVLLFLGLRTLHSAFRIRMGAEQEVEVMSPARAFRTAVAATASNPLTILTWGAVFTGATVGEVATDSVKAAAFVLGIGIGSLLLHLALAGVMAAVGGRLGTRGLTFVDAFAGLGLTFFGGLLAVRSVAAARDA